MSRFSQMGDFEEDDYYLTRMKDILEGYPRLGPLQHPSKLLEHVYIGNQDNADDLDLLQALEITHVLNCAGTRTFDLTRSPYRPDTGIVGFLMMPAEDYEEFDIMQYFMDAIVFLDKVKTAGGRALVHCNIGVNRSGAIVAAYLMVHQKRPILKVTEDLKSKRSLILQNVGFRRQLVRFARCRGLLDLPERPPKKLTFIASSYRSTNRPLPSPSKESTAASVTNQEKNENNNKSVANGTSNNTEEQSRDTPEITVNGSNDNSQVSKETNSEEPKQTGGGQDERNSPVPNNTNIGKYAGYENDIGNLDVNKEKPQSSSIPYLDLPKIASLRDDLERAYNKFSYLDLGSSQTSAKAERLLQKQRPASPHNLGNIATTVTDYTAIRSHQTDPSLFSEKRISSKLSALSLELPRTRVSAASRPTLGSLNRLSSDLLYPSDTTARDYYPSFRIPGIDKIVSPVPSLSRVSVESSISDVSNNLYASLDDVDFNTSKYNARTSLNPVSRCYFENGDDIYANYPAMSSPKLAGKTFSSAAAVAAEKFVSNIKPRSYYHSLVSPISSRNYPIDDIENGDLGYADSMRSVCDRPVLKSRSIYEGEGMLFIPYVANSSTTSASLPRNSISFDTLSSYRPTPYADRNYITASSTSYSRYTPNSRASLSALDSFGSYDSPTKLPNSGFYSSYRPLSTHRSVFEYDNALDEYSDLLDASLGRSSAIGSVAKSRVRSGLSAGSRRGYRY